ncbi:hypothetical protein BHM03_00046812, partial [Ensete ventricosum]
RKYSQKPKKEPRFAFKTRSKVDHLEDDFRWRKYGQKVVKNSPTPGAITAAPLRLNTKEFQLPLLRSYFESPLLDFARSVAPQNLLVTSDLTVSIEDNNQSVETAIRDYELCRT